MIEQTLTVVSISGTTAYLEAQQKKACEGCDGRCGSQIFGKLFGTAKKTFPYKFDTPLEVGQKVTLVKREIRKKLSVIRGGAKRTTIDVRQSSQKKFEEK